MPTLPWRAVQHPGAQAPTAVVMASRFRVRRFRDVPRFFLDSMKIHRQVLDADGALGVSLVAHPLRREFLTLSAWSDRSSLNALVRTDPHHSAMRRHHPVMAESSFTFWEVPSGDLPIDWHDARHRLDAGRSSSE
jgi:heme-degrading monooxygenase HmoA